MLISSEMFQNRKVNKVVRSVKKSTNFFKSIFVVKYDNIKKVGFSNVLPSWNSKDIEKICFDIYKLKNTETIKKHGQKIKVYCFSYHHTT